jgi:hypothetical protein
MSIALIAAAAIVLAVNFAAVLWLRKKDAQVRRVAAWQARYARATDLNAQRALWTEYDATIAGRY